MSTSKFYYYAFNTAPGPNSFSYFATASNTNDTDMGSGVYTHYYVVTGTSTVGVVATSNSSYASFKIGYNPTTAEFTVKAAEGCPVGTYEKVRLGVAVRKQSGGNKYYCGYLTFDITVTPNEMTETLNVERFTGMGYGVTNATVDFTAAKSFLGVSEVTTDMLSFVNPDGTKIPYSDYNTAYYDGWCDADGVATNWGNDTKICVKFFQAVSGGTYEICDMNGADVVGTTYTVKWALQANGKTYIYDINVLFVQKPVVEYNSTIYAQSRETESLRIPITDADVNFFGLTWDQVRTKLTATHTANSNSIGVANHTLATDEIMLYPADYASENFDQTKGVNWADNGHWFSDTGFVQDANNGEIAIALDWIGSSWVIYQKVNTLTAGDEYEVANALLYNDGTETKKIVFKFHITVAALDDVILADTQTSYEQHTGNCNVTLQRSLAAGKWLTFCAPFNIGAGEWEGMGISEVQRLTGVTYENNCVTFNFSDVTDGIWVGIPYIIKMSETKTGITKTETGYGAYDFQPTTTVEAPTGDCTAQMIGTYVKIALPNEVYYISDDKFYHTNYTGTNVTNMKGWRAYFTITTNSEVKGMAYQIGEKVEQPTAIEGLDVRLNDRVDVFTVSGQKVKGGVQRLEATDGLPAGIYIVGGKKVMVR